MDHRSFWDLVRARWVTLVVFILIGVTTASVYLLTSEPEYSAQAELFVAAVGSDNSSDDAQGSNYSQQQARIYSVFATREVVLGPVIEALELDTTPRELGRRVSASVPLNTSLISITVTDTSPDRAAATANAVATSVVNAVVRVVPKRTDGTTPVRLETIQSATSPVVSAAFSPPIIIVAGLLGGLIGGLAFITLREVASTRVRSSTQIEQLTGLSVLGSVVHDRAASKSKLLSDGDSGSPRFEEFRQLRTNVRRLREGGPAAPIVVTSSIPREGRSITAANLAITFAASGQTVCLVEADLRRPSLGEYLGMNPTPGLDAVLSGTAGLDDALRRWGSGGLAVLLAGSTPTNPTEMLESASTVELLDELTRRFDFVIVDSPPLLPVADASILARASGGALLVVGAGQVETRELQRAVEVLETAGTNAFGFILNNVPARVAGRFRNEYVNQESDSRGVEAAARTAGSIEIRQPEVVEPIDPAEVESSVPVDSAIDDPTAVTEVVPEPLKPSHFEERELDAPRPKASRPVSKSDKLKSPTEDPAATGPKSLGSPSSRGDVRAPRKYKTRS